MCLRRWISVVLSVVILISVLAGCHKTPNPEPVGEELPGGEEIAMEAIDLQDIQYETTKLEQKTSSLLHVKVNPTAKTGEAVTASVTVHKETDEFVYFIVDWGDGTWSYDGPYQKGTPGSLQHVYKTAGDYSVKAICKGLPSGETIGWSQADRISVTGDAVPTHYLTHVRPIGSDPSEDPYGVENISDNSNQTVWRSQDMSETYEPWVGYEFDHYYSLETLEIKISSDCATFPANLSIDYTTDRGRTWYSLPKYYYLYSYEEGRYDPDMAFPNPKGATIVLDLDGIVANGIRVSAKKFQTYSMPYLEVSEMRVTGEEETLFYSSKKGVFDADLNNMFTIFGTAATEPESPWGNPFRRGVLLIASCEWINWNGIKLRWTTDESIRKQYEATFGQIRTGQDGWSDGDGFVWATHDAAKHLGIQNHYTQNALFILEARNYLLMHNNVDRFLSSKNGARQTISDRIDKSMEYMLNQLEGASGILTIKDPANLGKAGVEESGSESSNYWDRYSAFGYQSTYENVFFYQAVLAMIDIETIRGNLDKVPYYIDLAKLIKEKYNELFWDEEKGRYITSVNVEGKRLDFGITFTNFMACAAGLASEEQAEKIYGWVDGDRIVAGDTSTGEDIYHYQYSARSNTIDVFDVEDNGYYWVSWNGDIVSTSPHGAFGACMQNGGTIFYMSYYDLMGRIGLLGADNAMERFRVIMKAFHEQDQLRVFPFPTDIGYEAGVIGEFPESGLVPTVFVEGFLGIQPGAQGLEICPNLSSDMTFAGVREYQFNETVYHIRVDKDLSEPKLTQEGDRWLVEVPADREWVLTTDQEILEKK